MGFVIREVFIVVSRWDLRWVLCVKRFENIVFVLVSIVCECSKTSMVRG